MQQAPHRYAGLGCVDAPGLSVADTSERLRRFAYAERRLMRLQASRIVALPQRDTKALLARFQYEDALHADGWRQRVVELRTNKSKLESAPDAALAALFDTAETCPAPTRFSQH